MKITIDIPDPIESVLRDRARRLEIPIEDAVIMALAHDTAHTAPAALTVQERMVQLVKQGFSDADIAGFTGFVPGYVATVRRAAGLPANRRIRRIHAA